MKSFARATKLPNISGRSDYIANPERQECIVAASAKVDWSEYAEYERYNQKTKQRNNEGRELVIQLPNEWSELPQDELHRRGDMLAQTVAGKGREVQWAMHWNKDHTNFHIHVIFSERQRENRPGVWDRDVYLSKTNQVARRKADRMVDADGNYILIHRKGEAKEPFTAKDPKFATQKWLNEVKAEIRSKLEELGVKFEKPGLLSEYHEGKGSDSKQIKAKNQLIRATNEAVAKFEQQRPLTPDEQRVLRKFALQGVKQGLVLSIKLEGTEIRVAHHSLKAHRQAMAEKPAPEAVQKPQKTAPAAPAGERAFREPPAPKPSQKLRAAFDGLKAAQEKVSSAQFHLSQANGLPFWNKQKKTLKEAASRELYAAGRECQDAFDRVVSFGVSAYHDGVQLSGDNLDLDDMKYLSRMVEGKIKDLEGKEAHEAKARPSLDDSIAATKERQREQISQHQEKTQQSRKTKSHDDR